MHLHLAEAAAALVAVLAVPAAYLGAGGNHLAGAPLPEMVEIAETMIAYPMPGEFLAAGRPAPAPVRQMTAARFRIMKHQVGLADYGLCVAAGACVAADASSSSASPNVPATGVSFLDATAYASWLSETTGQQWRLPTALEMAAAAAERFSSEVSTAQADDPANPSVRWLRQYREEAAASRPPDPDPKPFGHYGPNSLGVEDFGGNVWEWTSTCYTRVSLDAAGGQALGTIENCGVHVLEGRHRAYMSDFVREGKSGGCAVGTPPDNLGFRLVRDDVSLLGRLRLSVGRFLRFLQPAVS